MNIAGGKSVISGGSSAGAVTPVGGIGVVNVNNMQNALHAHGNPNSNISTVRWYSKCTFT